MKAKPHTEPGVFKENPKINQPVLKVFCDRFPSHRKTLSSALPGLPHELSLLAAGEEKRKQRGGPPRRRQGKRRVAGETQRRQGW